MGLCSGKMNEKHCFMNEDNNLHEKLSLRTYVIKFVSDLRPVGGFLQVLRFPPSIELTAMI
jgi:hypothetical protein